MNDYERSKMLRVQENQERLRQLGVKNIAKSFTSLVEGDKIKKRKKKTVANDNSVDYNPDSCGDGEKDDYEVATCAKLLQKLGMVVSEMESFFDSNASKNNQSNATLSMAQLILSKKGSLRQKEDVNCNSKEMNSARKSISSGSRRRLFDMSYEDLNEYVREQHSLVDDEIEDIEHIMFGNNQNRIELGSDSEDESENKIVEQVEEKTDGLDLQKKAIISNTKKRGPTMMHGIHVREFDACETIVCNKFGQPIGPVTKERDTVGQFSRFLGTIARNASYAPLTYSSWPKVPDKEMMWKYVLKRCLAARDLRLSKKNMHTAGPKSFARIREEMKNEDPNQDEPSLTQMFERTRQRKEGNVYADTYDDTENKIEKMRNYNPPEDESAPADPFLAVMNKEYDGHCILFGRGVTNTLIKKVNGDGSASMVPREIVKSPTVSLEVEKGQSIDMQRDLEANFKRRIGELKEDH
ncbi:transposase, Ptta/En/Spm, partial [Tanacetum coccineum]